MRFLQPDLRRHDRAGTHRWNDPVTASMFHFLFIDHQNIPAQLSGISAIVTAMLRYFDADGPRPDAIHRHLAWQGAAS